MGNKSSKPLKRLRLKKSKEERHDCVLADLLTVKVEFEISITDLSTLGRQLLLASEQIDKTREAFHKLHQILTDSINEERERCSRV